MAAARKSVDEIKGIDHLTAIIPNEQCFLTHVILDLDNVFIIIRILDIDFFCSPRYSINGIPKTVSLISFHTESG